VKDKKNSADTPSIQTHYSKPSICQTTSCTSTRNTYIQSITAEKVKKDKSTSKLPLINANHYNSTVDPQMNDEEIV